MPFEMILVVEDNTDIRFLIESTLTRDAYVLIPVVDADEAFEILATQAINLILLDIHLPKMNGLEFLEIIKNQSETQNIPVVAITANSVTANRKTCLDAGCMVYINKPFMSSELKRKLLKFSMNTVS